MQTLKNTFDFFKNFQSSTMLTISYNVDESKSKTVNKQKLVSKITTINVGIGQSYSNKVNKKLDKQGDNADFNPFQLAYAVRIPNTTNMLMLKKAITPNYKNYTDAQLQDMISSVPMDIVLENSLLQCITENKAQSTTYFLNGENGVTEIAKNDLKVGVHVLASFFEKSANVGRGSVSDENNFSIFNVYLKNLIGYKHGGQNVNLR